MSTAPQAHDDHQAAENPAPGTPPARPRGVKAAGASKEKQIEITLPPSITKELQKFIGDNPVRKRLEPQLTDKLRKVGSDSAVAAITGNIEKFWKEITG